METPELFTSHFTLASASLAAWGLVTILYIIFSLILVYHWRAYATNARVIRVTLLWYFISTITCLSAALLLIAFI